MDIEVTRPVKPPDPLRFRYPWEPMSRKEKLLAARAMLKRVKPGLFKRCCNRLLLKLEHREKEWLPRRD